MYNLKLIVIVFIFITSCNITETTFHEEYRMNIKVQDSCLSMVYIPEYQIPREFSIDWSNVSSELNYYCKENNKSFGWTTILDKSKEPYHFTVISIQPDPYSFNN